MFVEPRRNSLYRMMLTYTLRQADRVVFDSQAMKTELLAAGVEPEKLRGMALGVDTELFSPARRNVELIRKWGGGDSPIVFSSRNLRPIYNLEVLIRAAQTVVRYMPNTKLVICGDGEERERLQAIAEEPPANLSDGGTIRAGYHAPLDELRDISHNSRTYLAQIETRVIMHLIEEEPA